MKKSFFISMIIMFIIIASTITVSAINIINKQTDDFILMERRETFSTAIEGTYNRNTSESSIYFLDSNSGFFSNTLSESEFIEKMDHLLILIEMKEDLLSTELNDTADEEIYSDQPSTYTHAIATVYDTVTCEAKIYGPGLNRILFSGFISEEEAKEMHDYWINLLDIVCSLPKFQD